MSLVRIGEKPPASFADPIGVLAACHRRIEDRLATLERAAAALDERRDEALAAMNDALAWLMTSGARHTDDEEASLFPRLVGAGEADALLAELGSQHRTTEAILLALRTALGHAASEEAARAEARLHVAALCADLREHIALEDEKLLPAARRLDEAELRAIGIEMRLRRGGGDAG